jgi:hypothetical protein
MSRLCCTRHRGVDQLEEQQKTATVPSLQLQLLFPRNRVKRIIARGKKTDIDSIAATQKAGTYLQAKPI